MTPQQLIDAIQAVLSPDLLKKEYREKNRDNPLYGHCYAASEALYHLLGGKNSGWKPHCGRDEQNVTHWWLANAAGERLDPTAGQYTSVGLTPPYEAGRGNGFLTSKPSKRAQVIIGRISEKPS